jgi:uncharacterized membrane protein
MRAASLALVLAALAACLPSTETIDDATCPEDSELTYDNFGAEYLATYCQRCHASAAADRNGAPSSITFDTVEEVRDHMDRIYARAAGDNTSMPPGTDDPPAAEREMLGEWLACGAP